MTAEQLEALAVYRTHKHYQCQDCETARSIIKDFDAKRWSGKGTPCRPTNANTVTRT